VDQPNAPLAQRPPSAVSGLVGISGLLGLALAVLIARNFGDIGRILGYSGWPAVADGPYSALVALLFCGVPMLLWSVCVDKVHQRPTTGIDWTLKHPMGAILDISIVKIAGLWSTWAMIAIAYALCRFYWSGNYLFAMEMFQAAAVPMILLSVPYVVWLDRYLLNPRDGAWHFGAWISGRADWDRNEIFHHLRAWTVKGFFLAFMLSILPGGFRDIVNISFAEFATNPVWLAKALISAMFVIDVQFATVGYMLTMKPLDAHIRTANPYLAGWLAALMCYPPFILMNNGGLLDYHIGTRDWAYWFDGWPILLWIWGALLVLLTGIYAWSTVAFGLRFSNLTHRGILTHGPYALSKHPAYLAKNIYWWLATLPFLVITSSVADMIRNSAILALISGIYYWRAKTEERHLMTDPAYVTYAAWMNQHAIVPRFFASLRRLVGKIPRTQGGVEPAE
jgi:hypothetical protein